MNKDLNKYYKYQEFKDILKTYVTDQEKINQIDAAFEVALNAHKGQNRKSGEPYFHHLIEVTIILAKVKASPDSIIVGFLHDILEDTNYLESDINKKFSEKITKTIKALTKIKQIKKGKNKQEAERNSDEYLKQLIIGISQNKEILLIKLADRLHNMRTLKHIPKQRQQYISEETRKIYVPIASRLGLHWIKSELEDLCFYYLDNKNYNYVKKLVDNDKNKSAEFIQSAINNLEEIINASNGKIISINGRKKHLYSIHRKMNDEGKEYSQIYDILAIRIVTNNTIDAYKILGILSTNYNLIPDRFKDYINKPKENFYQALHIGLFMKNIPLEIQIMTEEMMLKSLIGLSSHTAYKETHTKLLQNNNFLEYIMEYANNEGKKSIAKDFVSVINTDLFSPTFSVLTPTGEKVIVNKGSTSLDFAFKIHTNLALHASYAIVNSKKVTLSHSLKEGDIVEIVADYNKLIPLKAINWVNSKNAASRIRSLYFDKNQSVSKEIDISYGIQIIEDFIQKNPEYSKLLSKKSLEIASRKLNLDNLEDLYVKLATKDIYIDKIISTLRTSNKSFKKQEENAKKTINLSKLFKFPEESKYLNNKFTFKLAACNPIYGEKIKAEINTNWIINREKRVYIHRQGCYKAIANPKSFIDINWNEKIDNFYSNVEVKITAFDNNDLLQNIINAINISNTKVLKLDINVDEKTETSNISLVLKLNNVNQLDRFYLQII